jgi:DNA-binding transcriptional LysR family regulator
MDLLKCLKTFCAVVESGSFTEAAEIVYVTQPSISTHINELEEHYKTKLLNRKRDGITPTATGKLLYKNAKEVFKQIQVTEDEIDKINNLLGGSIEIGASTVPGTYIIPALIAEFKKNYPHIKISLKIKDTNLIINDVFEQKISFGIVGDRTKKSGLKFHKLTGDRIVLIANPSVKKSKLNLDELKEMKFIFRESNSGTRAAVVNELKKHGISIKQLNIAMELGSTEAVKQGVMKNLGASFVSERTINTEKENGLLKIIPIERIDIKRNFWLVKRSNTRISRAENEFFKFLSKKENLK